MNTPFLHNFYNSDLDLDCEMADVDLVWNYFKTTILALINKQSPQRTFRVSKDNLCFNESISSSVSKKDKAWAKAEISN